MDRGAGKEFSSSYLHVSGKDAIDQIQLGQEESALQLIVVKGNLPGPGAVQAGLHERGPGVLEQESSPDVILADPGSSGEHGFPTVVLHGIFSEKEVGEISNVVRWHEVRFWRQEGRRNVWASIWDLFTSYLFGSSPKEIWFCADTACLLRDKWKS